MKKNLIKKSILLGLLVFSGTGLRAQAPAPGGIVVDESNFKAIFNESVTQETDVLRRKGRTYDLELAGSYTSIGALVLKNNYFSVDYAEDFKSIPSLSLGLGKEFWAAKYSSLSVLGSLGYGYKEGRVLARSTRGSTFVDQVALQWLPISAGLRFSQKVPGIRRFSAFVTPSLGSQYFSQAGNLDGMNQGYWVSFWNLRGGLVLFESLRESSTAAFDGVVLGGNIARSLGSVTEFKSWSADLGLRFAL